MLDRIRCGQRVDHYETVRKRSDDRLVDSASPLRNSAGEVIDASKIARDITKRKHAEIAQPMSALVGGMRLVLGCGRGIDTPPNTWPCVALRAHDPSTPPVVQMRCKELPLLLQPCNRGISVKILTSHQLARAKAV